MFHKLTQCNKEVFFIGGKTIYEQALHYNIVDRIIITKVHGVFKGDTTFPLVPKIENWKVISHEPGKVFDRIILKRVSAKLD
jgi:dihydrofolate reductase